MRRVLASAAAALAACVGLAAQASPQRPPAPTGLIVGQVVDGTSGQPIADATVLATGQAPVLTIADGRFVVRGLKPGQVFFRVTKPGYLEAQYGQTRPGGVSRGVTLAEGEKTADVAIKMWRPAAVSGRIVDEAGEPVVGVQVRAMRRVIRSGEWRFNPGTTISATDDRGIYRFSDLLPGTWIVSVLSTTTTVPTSVAELYEALGTDPAQRAAYQDLSSTLGSVRAPRMLPGTAGADAIGDSVRALGAFPGPQPSGDLMFVYPTEFFAGATSPARATLIPLTPGQDRTGVDFSLRPVRAVRVSGVVTGPDGPGQHIPLQLLSPETIDIDGDVPVSATVTDAAGHFTFLGVPPGPYVLRAFKAPAPTQVTTQVGAITRVDLAPPAPDAPTYWARQELAVGNAGLSNVAVTLGRGVRVSGRIVFEGVASAGVPSDFRNQQLWFAPVDGRAPSLSNQISDRVTLTAEQFQTIEIPPGRYFVRALPAPWTLVSVVSGGRDVSESPLTLGDRPVTDLVATFTKQTKTLTGSIRTARNEVATGSFAIAFPSNRPDWINNGVRGRRFQLIRASQTGMYEFRDLPVGEYFLVALSEDPGDDWVDPQLLSRWSADGVRVTVTSTSAAGPDLRARTLMPVGVGTTFRPSPEPEQNNGHGPYVSDEPDDSGQSGGQVRDNIGVSARGSAEIAGIVEVSDGAGTAPVRRATVSVTCNNPRVGRTIVTDETGTFVFRDLPACRYQLMAQKIAYITARYGATGIDRPGTPIAVGEGQRVRTRLLMERGAVISGVVRDGRGDPIPNATVQILRFRSVRGEQRLDSVPDTLRRTDSLGAYRVYGLPPGEFVVGSTLSVDGTRSVGQLTASDIQSALLEVRGGASSISSPQTVAPVESGYAATFYPRTTNPAEAAAIKLEAGEERTGVDITVELVRLSRITLRVTVPDGRPPGTAQGRFTTLIAVGGFIGSLPLFPSTSYSGEIVMPLVPPGQFSIAVTGSSEGAPASPARGGTPSSISTSDAATIAFPQWAIVPVTVSGQDMTLDVRLEQGKTLAGRVVFSGTIPPPDLKSVTIGLAGPTMAGVSLVTPAKAVSPTGTFSFDSVVPSAYRVTAGTLKGWSMASATINGQDASDRPVDVSSDVPDVVVTFTDKTTDFSGTLQTPAGQPAPDYHVIVFPADRSFWIYGSRRIVSLRPGTDGRFVTNALPPGDYLVAAVRDVQNEEWFNTPFLEVLEAASVKVTVAYGLRTVQDLRIR